MHKTRSSDGDHKCKYCGKEFKNEFYIDRLTSFNAIGKSLILYTSGI
jgi:hypothetical protein